MVEQKENWVVYGLYSDRPGVERAVELLKERNFRNGDISALLPGPDSTKDFAHTKGTKAPEGAVVGGTSGALVGGTLGWLAGIGSLAIPGVGPFIAAGPIMGLIAGIGAGSMVGGIAGALIGLGMPEYEAKRYAGRINEGGILLSVHVEDKEWEQKARDILESTGATDISCSSEATADNEPETEARVGNF